MGARTGSLGKKIRAVIEDAAIANAAAHGIYVHNAFPYIITPGDTMDHRDHGDETPDFDVVNDGCASGCGCSAPAIEPVISVNSSDRVSTVLQEGIEVGDFTINPDGSIEPVVPEIGEVNHTWIKVLIGELLIATGHNPQDPGIVDTPRRVADMWREFIEYDPGKLGTLFESITTDQMVVVSGMEVWSMCEHHMLPFRAKIAIAVLAKDKILGLSKFGRIAHKHAHKLQLQERLVQEIADEVKSALGTDDVAVIAQGEHLCMTMRGVRTPHLMSSSAMSGVFLEKPEARSEFMRLAGL